MNREEKAVIISELKESFSKSTFSVVADYRGLTVAQMEKIRIELRNCNSEIRVAKNTLLKRAVTETGCDVLSDDFTGTTAVVMAYDDPVGPAKALADFAKDHEKFILRSAVLEGEKLGLKELESLAKLPSKEVLLGQLLTVLNGVPQGLVQVLSAVPRNFGYGLQALKDQKEQFDN